MKNSYKFLCLLLALPFLSNAQSILWEISGKKLSTPSYLYGTIHIQDKRVFNFDEIVEKKFESCDAYAMEIVLDEIDPKVQQEAILMKKHTMQDLLSKEDYHLLDSVFKVKIGTSVMLYSKMKPFFLASQLMQVGMSKDMPDALDMYFLKKARKEGKKVLGVEEFETQIGAIDQISLKEQCDMLMESIKDTTSKEDENFEDLLNAYFASDFNKMLELSADTSLPDNFNKAFLIDRNAGMVKSISKIIKKQKTFVAVGAAHLGGKKGVIYLLRKKGYTVKPIPFKFYKTKD